MGPGGTRTLLSRVSARMWLASVGAWWRRGTLALAAVYALALVTVRLLALLPDVLDPLTILAVPGAALAGALFIARRATDRQAGRAVDASARTDDLFLTAAALDGAVGEFQPLVTRDAEARAGAISPRGVVPFGWQRGARDGALALGALLAGVLLLPQLDPFGAGEVRERDDRRREELAETRKATELRKAVLKEEAARESTEIDRAVADLKKAFREMKPVEPQKNLERIALNQKELGRLWRELGEEKLRDALTETPMFQRFGRADAAKLEQWKKELEQGKADSLAREMSELKELARKLAEAGGPAERERLRRELKERLRDLAAFASGDANSRRLSDAAKQALSQLDMSGMKGMSREALEGLAESLGLTEQEIQALAQRARELATLEDALSAAQLAKAANASQPLDGQAAAGLEALEEYAALYRSIMGTQAGSGPGPGMGGPGRGEGNLAPEDPDQETAFKDEMSRSALTAGRMLMKWKADGPADTGEAREDYRESLARVKQSVAEALVKEQVPPGYHEVVKRYFDSLGADEAGGADE